MPRYSLQITIAAERLPEPDPPARPFDPGMDPIRDLTETMKENLAGLRATSSPFSFNTHRPSGLNSTRSIEVTVESFDALAKILSNFDHLAEQIECANP